jgi:hypothetical protein
MPLRLRSERGFTTVTLMGVLMVGGLLVIASFAAVNPDIALTRDDRDSKQAYAAAESGLQWYLSALVNNNSYYTLCDNPPAPSATELAPVNQRYQPGQAKPFKWRRLPGEQAKYAIELLPAEGRPACTADQYSMVDRYGNLKIRVTGRSRDETRTINATLRRLNFLDFIYFTHFETLDPVATDSPSSAATACAQFRAARPSPPCVEIQFADDDDILGPMHTNDNILVCGHPQLGRTDTPTDRIELNGPQPVVSACGGSGPDYQGTLIYPAGELEVPKSNAQLATLATADYLFRGKTEIVLNGGSMSVRNRARWGDDNPRTMALPANGVIYVDHNGTCTSGYVREQTYPTGVTEERTCGNAWVSGNYAKDLTIAAANDVIVTGNLQRANDTLLLGLVANNFVRVYHPVTWSRGECVSNAAGALSNPTIQAAILALNHSFIVDNWDCGARLGDLTVDGAIAQYYRGPVGHSRGNGYFKNYRYNDRLRYREPPYFLDPVLSAWRISRQSEQLPPMSNLPD